MSSHADPRADSSASAPGARTHRGTIFVEDAEVLSNTAFPGGQFILKVCAPECARTARPGAFAHITCDPALPMRRPLSIMRASAREGWLEFLYKTVGQGLTRLGQRRVGERVSLMGPIGQPFRAHPDRPHTVLIGGGVGIPPMIFLAEHLAADAGREWQPLALLGSEIPFPFPLQRSAIPVPGLPDALHAGMPLLEAIGIPSRLASGAGFPGCYRGHVTALAASWLERLPEEARRRVELFACGPVPMLEAAARLARDFALPCQVSLEEFMACATGGCAGCTVLVHGEHGPAMRRVCVDGPVFDAHLVYPP